MKLTKEDVARILVEFSERSETCRKVGIPLVDVRNQRVIVPPGWIFDPVMCFFMPPAWGIA
jgi:hypothetical protein